MEVQLGDLAVEVIRLRLRNDYAWARERKRVREKGSRTRERGERETAEAKSVCLTPYGAVEVLIP